MQGFCPLASGSKGNCLFLGTKNTRVLIDAGLSAKMTKSKLEQIGVDLSSIDAILVTHEHIDHIRGIGTLAETHKLPIFANSDTAKAICDALDTRPRFKIFCTGEPFEFGDLEIHPFSVQHDTLDPVAFTIRTANTKVGICADLGFVTTLVKTHLKECDYLYIEANHDPAMVYASNRPLTYKQRVLSRQGHLCNRETADLLAEVFHPKLQHIYLAHLSEECNHPDLALKTVRERLNSSSVRITIAKQHEVSEAILFAQETLSAL